MPKPTLKPRLYLDPTRKRWVVRYGQKFKRTPYLEHQREAAEKYLGQVLNHASWLRALRSLRPTLRVGPRLERAGAIYFVSKLDCLIYPIKVGFCAGNLDRRLIDIQTGNPELLGILASQVANFGTERKLHDLFADFRLAGEWFSRAPIILDALDAARRGELMQWLEDRSGFIRSHSRATQIGIEGGTIDLSI